MMNSTVGDTLSHQNTYTQLAAVEWGNSYPYLVGYVDFYLKDYAGAIAELQKADQEDPFILLLLAQAYEKSGKAASARDYYRKVLASTSHAVNNAFARPVARQKMGSMR